MLDLELVQPARAAARAEPRQLRRMLGIGDVEYLQPAEDARVGARAAADLDPDHGDVMPGERLPVGHRVDHDVLRGGPRRAAQPRGKAPAPVASRASITAMPLTSSSGQKRWSPPVFQSENPQEPT